MSQSRSKCMQCSKPPEFEVLWAEGMAHAWFCSDHFSWWIGKNDEHTGGLSDVDSVKAIKDGKASKKFQDNKSPNIIEQFKKAEDPIEIINEDEDPAFDFAEGGEEALRPLIGHVAGKFRMRGSIIPYFPVHKTYVEPMCGSAAVFFGKKLADKNVIADMSDPRLYILRFLKYSNDKELQEFMDKDWESSEKKWKLYQTNMGEGSAVDRAYKAVFVIKNSFDLKTGGYYRPKPANWKIEHLQSLRDKLKSAIVLQQDYKKTISRFDAPSTFFYIDPPYPSEKWGESTGGRTQNFDWVELYEVLKKIKGKWMFSTSEESIKKVKPLPGWHVHMFEVLRTAQKAKPFREKEALVTNFPIRKTGLYTLAEEIDTERYPNLQTTLGKLKDIPEFVWIPNFVSVSGSVVYGKHKPNDTDVIIRLKDLPEALALKLSRIFEGRFGDAPHFVPDESGPVWTHLVLYDLVLKPRFELVEVEEPEFEKEFYKSRELRAASEEVKKEAEESMKENKIVMFRFYYPAKVTTDYFTAPKEDPHYSTKKVEEFFSKQAKIELLVQKKYDGMRVTVFKDKDKVMIYSEDGTDLTERFPTVVEQAKAISNDFIIEAEVERWRDGLHLAREMTSAYAHEKGKPDDAEFVFNTFDCLYLDKDIHTLKYSERLDDLKKLGIKQSTIDIPSTKLKFNIAPTFKVEKLEELDHVLNECATAISSEGAMIKEDSPYPLTGDMKDSWKFKKYAQLNCMVLARNQTKVPTIFNYEIGVSFTDKDKVDPKTILKSGGKEYSHVGRSYNTDNKLEAGDIITIQFHSINLYETDKGEKSFHLYEPIFFKAAKELKEPDTFSNAISIGEKHQLLGRKFSKENDLEKFDPANATSKEVRNAKVELEEIIESGIYHDKGAAIEKLSQIYRVMIARNEKVEIPKGEVLQEELKNILPTLVIKGVFIKEPHALWISQGLQTKFIKRSRIEDHENIPLLLLSESKAYGIISFEN
ncbi:MAG: DNA adenine methylase, partial [candidate division Zixibacteria bacterium]|nr:DNA adenine methylase [candidate division Zixibacteria bacterium]